MTQRKWTSGPWISTECLAGKKGHGWEITDKKDLWVASANNSHLGHQGFPCDTEGEANAHLIAAAPCLYEALEAIVECVALCTDNDGNPTIEICVEDDFSEARAVLAKARGETS